MLTFTALPTSISWYCQFFSLVVQHQNPVSSLSPEYTMADTNQEVNSLRGLVVKLSKEIDYKNHLLMQKEGLSLEKFATMSCLIEEKDRLLGERSEVIGALMAQKYRLHEAYTEGMHTFEDAKLELEKVKRELEVAKFKHYDQPTMALVEYQEETGDGLGTVQDKSDDSQNEHDREHKSLILHSGAMGRQFLKVHDKELRTEIDTLREELDEKVKALHQIESLYQDLLSMEHLSNEELQAARKEAMNCFLLMDGKGTTIGIKRMGEIDPQPFRDVCSKTLCNRTRKNFDQLYSSWQEKVNDPRWKPFKKEIDNGKVVVDENDKKLVKLRKDCGEESYKAVVDALLGLNEYNPDIRHPIPELWNFKEGRRAYLNEVIHYMIQQCEIHRDRENKQSANIFEVMAEKERLLMQLASVSVLVGEKDQLLNEKYAAIGKLMAQVSEKDKMLGKLSATISAMSTEKCVLLENLKAGTRGDLCMKKQGEELDDKLEPTIEERKGNDYRGNQSMTIKIESMDYGFESSSNPVEPLRKKFKDSQVSKCNVAQ